MLPARRAISLPRYSPWRSVLHSGHVRHLTTTVPHHAQSDLHPGNKGEREDKPSRQQSDEKDHDQTKWSTRGPQNLEERYSSYFTKLPKNESTRADYVLPTMSLRDMCKCPRCVDSSTRQKLFSTVDIPPDIAISNVTELPNGVMVEWDNDLPGFDKSHQSIFENEVLDAMATRGTSKTLPRLPRRRFWADTEFRTEAPDLTYEAYMEDDATLYKALQQLHSHGLLFLKNVPESPDSVSRIVQRIGPLKNTFYGETWDVRSVPEAKNVAYTSQDLGFHMDLLYMKQPPHLQFLHCIRSSASGGASLFTDSFKAISDLFHSDLDAFCELESRPITFHYDHIDSHYYQQSRPLIELAPLRFSTYFFSTFRSLRDYDLRSQGPSWRRKGEKKRRMLLDLFSLESHLDGVSWAPPFQAPFELTNTYSRWSENPTTINMEINLRNWHAAAQKFNKIIHKEENIHERMMKPGECVLFDNRRVLHARKAFEVADAGKERWLRGAYLDKDPFMSKLRVMAHRFKKEQREKKLQALEQETAELVA
jgi:gamma-butyrobetaine dioxygenase